MGDTKESKDTKVVIAIIVAVIEAITAIIVALIQVLAKSNLDETGPLPTTDIKQIFTCDVSLESCFDLEYTKYELYSSPSLSSYKVIPLPYIMIEKEEEERIYISLLSQFSQTQYVADSSGVCVLIREKTTEDLVEYLKEQVKYNVSKGCYLAIEYISADGERHVVYYRLDNGPLHEVSGEEIAPVIYNLNNEDTYKINMMDWPESTCILDLIEEII